MSIKTGNNVLNLNQGFKMQYYLVRAKDNEIICRSQNEKSIKVQADHFKMLVGECDLIIRDDEGNEKKY